jgi:triosephosphate isomerase (TIM)
MEEGLDIRPPFFEVGPKAYAWGEALEALARHADGLCIRCGVSIIITPQYVDIPRVAAAARRVLVFAQHMDGIPAGRGVGSVLPEALREAGARGVMLNHCERRLGRAELEAAMRRAREVGLATMVCADTPEEAVEMAQLGPDIVLAEAPALVGGARRTDADREDILRTNAAVRAVDPRVRVLHGAGISGARDVYDVVKAGAEGTGSSSAIFGAADWRAELEAMVRAMRRAWDETHPEEACNGCL